MRGEIEFAPALRERVALLKGLPATVVDEVIDERIRLTPGARTLVATMRANGAYTCLVTGGFTLFSRRIAAHDRLRREPRQHARWSMATARLTGDVSEPIFGREAKLATLIELTRNAWRWRRSDTLVAGDGANDIAMIEAAGLGVAYHAKPKVAEAAAARIDHGDLTALLYAARLSRGTSSYRSRDNEARRRKRRLPSPVVRFRSAAATAGSAPRTAARRRRPPPAAAPTCGRPS